MGYNPRLINNILAIFITYIANLGVPRSGEFFRATVLQTYEKIPFEKSFGTIIAERTIDLLMLLPVSYTHLRAHETGAYLVCRLLLEKKK